MVQKIIVILSLIFIFNKVFAGDSKTIVINKSNYDIKIQYQFCQDSPLAPACTSPNVITIKSKSNDNQEKNYAIIATPSYPTKLKWIQIINAQAQDKSGKIISEASYSTYDKRYCIESLVSTWDNHELNNNAVFVLNVIAEPSLILCRSDGYVE